MNARLVPAEMLGCSHFDVLFELKLTKCENPVQSTSTTTMDSESPVADSEENSFPKAMRGQQTRLTSSLKLIFESK